MVHISFGIYDTVLAEKIAELLKTNDPFPRGTMQGLITISDGVVSVCRDLYDVDAYGGYYVMSLVSEDGFDDRNPRQIAYDEKTALNAETVIRSLRGFFDSSFPDAQVCALVTRAVKERGVVCQIRILEDLEPMDYAYMASKLRQERESFGAPKKKKAPRPTTGQWSAVCDDVTIDYEGRIFVLSGFDKETEEEPLASQITTKGGIIKSSVVLATDYLVVNQKYRGGETTKYKRALELIERGKNIHIISGDKLFSSLGAKPITEKFNIRDRVLVGYRSHNKDVVIPDGIVEIGEDSFSELSIRSVTVPEGVVSIGPMAFCQCTRLERVTLPASLQNIGGGAFAGCTALTNVDIHPDSPYLMVKDGSICSKDGRALLYHIDGRKQDVLHLTDPVIAIGEYAFTAQAIKQIRFNRKLTKIGDWAFWSCANLTELTMPESLTDIGGSAFLCCQSLTKLHIPERVERIGEEAFAYCPSLSNVTLLGRNVEIGENAFGSERKIRFRVTKQASPALIEQLGKYAASIETMDT